MCVPAVPCVHSFLTQARLEESSLLVHRPLLSQCPYDMLLCSHSDGLLSPAVFAGMGVAASSLLVMCQPLSTLAEMLLLSIRQEPLRHLHRAHTSQDRPALTSPRWDAYLYGNSMLPSPSASPVKTKGVVVGGGADSIYRVDGWGGHCTVQRGEEMV